MRNEDFFNRVVAPALWIFIILLTALTSGCKRQVVYLPTPIPCPEPPAFQRPQLPISGLTGKESYGELLRAFGASVAVERGYSKQLELILEGYRPKGGK